MYSNSCMYRTILPKKVKLHTKPCELIITVILMPCPSTDRKMFWAGQNFLCQTKRWFALDKFSFCAVTKSF